MHIIGKFNKTNHLIKSVLTFILNFFLCHFWRITTGCVSMNGTCTLVLWKLATLSSTCQSSYDNSNQTTFSWQIQVCHWNKQILCVIPPMPFLSDECTALKGPLREWKLQVPCICMLTYRRLWSEHVKLRLQHVGKNNRGSGQTEGHNSHVWSIVLLGSISGWPCDISCRVIEMI